MFGNIVWLELCSCDGFSVVERLTNDAVIWSSEPDQLDGWSRHWQPEPLSPVTLAVLVCALMCVRRGESWWVCGERLIKRLTEAERHILDWVELLPCYRSLNDLISKMVVSQLNWEYCQKQPTIDDCMSHTASLLRLYLPANKLKLTWHSNL